MCTNVNAEKVLAKLTKNNTSCPHLHTGNRKLEQRKLNYKLFRDLNFEWRVRLQFNLSFSVNSVAPTRPKRRRSPKSLQQSTQHRSVPIEKGFLRVRQRTSSRFKCLVSPDKNRSAESLFHLPVPIPSHSLADIKRTCYEFEYSNCERRFRMGENAPLCFVSAFRVSAIRDWHLLTKQFAMWR